MADGRCGGCRSSMASGRLCGIIAQADIATRVNRDKHDRRAGRGDLGTGTSAPLSALVESRAVSRLPAVGLWVIVARHGTRATGSPSRHRPRRRPRPGARQGAGDRGRHQGVAGGSRAAHHPDPAARLFARQGAGDRPRLVAVRPRAVAGRASAAAQVGTRGAAGADPAARAQGRSADGRERRARRKR